VVGAERPKLPPFRPVLLEPDEIRRVLAAFTDPRLRTVFLTVTLTGMRCSELQELRWKHVNLLEQTLRVVDAKSEEGWRLIAIPPTLVTALEERYQQTPFKGDEERVFTSRTGSNWWIDRYGPAFRKALAAAGVTKQPRRLHDGRHGALTAMAANSSSPVAIQHVAGHASMQTTRKYIHLAGTVFPEEAAKLEARQLSTQLSTHLTPSDPTSEDRDGSESGLET
jgi:integrase